jgi:hypothetical protein
LVEGLSQQDKCGEQVFWFNQDKQLYSYMRRYPAPLTDYKDELLGLFGPCPNEPRTQRVPEGQWTAFDYVFPRVVVRVASIGSVATAVGVVDRRWLSRVLEDRRVALSVGVSWVRAWQNTFAHHSVENHEDWTPDLSKVPTILGCKAQLVKNRVVSSVEYTRTLPKGHYGSTYVFTRRGEDEAMCGAAMVRDGSRLEPPRPGPVPQIQCLYSLLPGMDREQHLKKEDRSHVPAKPAIEANGFVDEIAVRLLVILLQDAFPPDKDPRTGNRLYQENPNTGEYSWHWTDGNSNGDRWLVTCQGRGEMRGFVLTRVNRNRSL